MSDASPLEVPPVPIADALAATLRGRGHDASADGRNVRAAAGLHSLWVTCSKNERERRYDLSLLRSPSAGPPFTTVARGETSDEEVLVRAVEVWLGAGELDAVVAIAPFVGRAERMHDAILAALPSDVRVHHRGERYMRVERGGRAFSIDIRRGDATLVLDLPPDRVARITDFDRVIAAARDWLEGELAPDAVAERHGAEILTSSRHRWRQLYDETREPDTYLASLEHVVRALSDDPVVSAFYPMTSMWTLCICASSVYPFVSERLPAIGANRDGTFSLCLMGTEPSVERTPRLVQTEPVRIATLEELVATVRATVAAYPVRPFVGSARELPR